MGAGKTRRPPVDRRGTDRAAQAPGHGVVAFAGTASLERKARDAPEPGHTLVPVQQSPGEARKGQQGGRRDAGGLCCLTRVRRGRRTAGREGTGVSQQPCSANPHCTHSPFPPTVGRQSPLCSAATAPTTLQRPCATPRPSQIQLRGLAPPESRPAAACGKREQGVNENQGAQRGAAVSWQRWEVEGPGSLRTWRCQTSKDRARHQR